jgi:hypothetical protein
VTIDLASGPLNAHGVVRWRAHEPDWRGYAIGYRRAAEALTDREAADGVHVDTLVLPIAGLFRHALELHLKWLAVVLNRELGESVRLLFTHDIERLWRHLEEPLRSLGLDGGEWERIGTRVHLIAEIDPKGHGLRYPVRLEGESPLTLEALNLVALASVAGEVLDALAAAVDGAIGEGRDRAQEAMHEAAQEWWYSLSDEERAGYEEAHAVLPEAYLAGYIP